VKSVFHQVLGAAKSAKKEDGRIGRWENKNLRNPRNLREKKGLSNGVNIKQKTRNNKHS